MKLLTEQYPAQGVAAAVHRIASQARSHFVARPKYLARGGRRHDLSLGPWESLDSRHEALPGPLRLGPGFQSHPLSKHLERFFIREVQGRLHDDGGVSEDTEVADVFSILITRLAVAVSRDTS
ncbi:hypothetical protein Tco_0398447 [Tanacetum coccineum]